MDQLTLESVQRDFTTWRTSRAKKSRIPQDLWDKTLKLLDHYPISRVARDLRLSGGQLSDRHKRHLAANSNIVPVKNAVNFLELNIPRLNATDIPVNKLEIKRVDGAVLAIEQLTLTTLLEILNQFMRGI